jgi:hypothetical protein
VPRAARKPGVIYGVLFGGQLRFRMGQQISAIASEHVHQQQFGIATSRRQCPKLRRTIH